MDIDEIKVRLGIDSQDTGFDEALNAYLSDAFDTLGVFVGQSLTDEEKLFKTAQLYAQNYVIRAFNEQGLSQTGIARLDALCLAWQNGFAVEKFNKDNAMP